MLLVWPELTLGASARHGFLAGIVALQIASFRLVARVVLSKRHARGENVLGMTACQMLAGGLIMLRRHRSTASGRALSFATDTTLALVYLATVGAIGGFVAYNYALRHLPVSFVSLYAYINPVIAVTLGVLLLGERSRGEWASPPLSSSAAWPSFDGPDARRWPAAASRRRSLWWNR